MTETNTADAENLTAAVAELDRAVGRFLSPRMAEGRPEPSLWAEVCRRRLEPPPSSGNRAVHRFSGSPVCLSSLQIHSEVVGAVRQLATDRDDDPAVLLDSLTRTSAWRPQDTSTVLDWCEAVTDWCRRALAIVEPERRMEVRARCPACETRTVYRHKDGEDIRVPALSVSVSGADCIACGAHWSPAQFGLLIAVLEGE